MVPYINFPYAEHILKQIGVADSNAKTSEKDIEILIKAARACQDLARNLETQEIIPGYLIYTDKPVVEKKPLPISGPLADQIPE
jgi:hypothetical protein